jgi:hypothetical protein
VFPEEYKQACQADMHKYDLAYLILEENSYVENDQILELKWNLKEKNPSIEVIGYSPNLDKQF